MKIPASTDYVAAAIDSAHEARAAVEEPRPHMGASLLGHKCDRYLWLNFRWAVQEKFTGRMLRLFRRGQNEEATIVEDLRLAGIDIVDTDENGNQLRVDFGCHVSGSTDGVLPNGVPQSKKPHVAEMKTHNEKSFNKLVQDGVEKAKPQHYTQMQTYMRGLGIDRALYIAVCKNDDRMYTERVKFDPAHADAAIERGKRIALSDRMPEPMPGASPSWFECKFCAMYDFCHNEGSVERNCRTCKHSQPNPDGSWVCYRWEGTIPTVSDQFRGCSEYTIHDDMKDLEIR